MPRRLLPLVLPPLLLLVTACGTSGPARLRNDDPGAAAAWAAAKRAGSADALESLRVARAAMRAMPRYSTTGDVLRDRSRPRYQAQAGGAQAGPLEPWSFLGPGNVGGRTRVLVIDPTDTGVMYAGGVSGGLWKTTNGGERWEPLADDLANIAINSLAMDPVDPLTLYAGTGEGYFREEVRGTGLPLRGNGIFVTRDGGTTWSHLVSTLGPDFHFVNDLVVSDLDHTRLYAATRTGVWRSGDSGATWQNIHPSSEKGGCLELAYRSDTGGDFLFASCGTLSQATVYRSTDASGDGPWEAVLSEPNMGRTSLAIAPSNPAVVYALAATNEAGAVNQGLLAVYRSTAGGAAGSWEARVTNRSSDLLSTLLLTNPATVRNPYCSAYGNPVTMGWYCNTIAVDPLDSDRVWAGGVDLFRSDDGGAKWGAASYWWPQPSTSSFVHADQHAIVFHPEYDGASNRTIFFANDGGVYKTDDATADVGTDPRSICYASYSDVEFEPIIHNYGVTQFYHGAVSADGRTFLGGTQDNGTVLGRIDAGPDAWEHVLGGDGTYVAIDPNDPSIMYAQSQYGRVYRSTDGGELFRSARDGLNDDFPFVTPLQIDPNDPKLLWLGGTHLWRTSNSANSWVRASAQLQGQVSSIGVAPGDSNRVAAGTTQGWIVRSDNAKTTTSNSAWAASRPREGWVSWVAFDPFDASVLYATYAGFGGPHVWRSTDAGATWTAIDATLPDIPVHSIALDPTRRDRIYLGTDLGVFVSLDGGVNWAVENTGFATVVTETVFVGQGENGPAIYAFTHGRGAWRAELTRERKRRAVRKPD